MSTTTEPSMGVQTHLKRHPTLALVVIACAQLMVILDATIVNVALPTIRAELHFSAASLEWVITAYAVTFGGLLLFGGRTGDLYGKRRMFMVGVGLFAIASLFGGLATNELWLIITRGLQGVGGAIASPTALSLVAINFSEGPERNRAMGVYSAMSALGGALGLLLGGLLTSYVSWRWIFFVNVPIGAAGLLMAPRVLQESIPTPGRLDVPGALTVTAGMLSLVYSLTNASLHPWSSMGTVIPLVGAGILLMAFVAIERSTPAPLMPLSIFKSRNRSGAYAIMLALGVAVFAVFFFMTQYLQDIQYYSAVRTGVAFLPMSVAIMVAAVGTSRLLGKISIRVPLLVGPILALAGELGLSRLTPTSGYAAAIIPLVLIAFGMGQSFVPLTVTVMSGVAPNEAGLASALLNTGQQVGGALGLAVLGTIAISAAHRYMNTALSAHHRPTAALLHAATVHGYTRGFEVGTLIAAVALLVSVFVLRKPSGSRESLPVP